MFLAVLTPDAKRLVFKSWALDALRKVCCVSDSEYNYPAMCHAIQKREKTKQNSVIILESATV